MSEERLKAIQSLVTDCYIAHQEDIIAGIIYQLEKEYDELATLSSLGEYKKEWSHDYLLDFITYET
jgi:hypothetical protein